MIVEDSQFYEVLEKLKAAKHLGLDTETTGTSWQDKLFSFAISTPSNVYYFNFNTDDSVPDDLILSNKLIREFRSVFANPQLTLFAHNAKFDMRMMAQEGIVFHCKVHCTMALERVVKNNHKGYSLDECAQRRGKKKQDEVMEYLKEHRLYDSIQVPGRARKEKRYFFDKVLLPLILKYCEHDAVLTREIGMDQQNYIHDSGNMKSLGIPSLEAVAKNEIQLTKVCFDMEAVGVRVNTDYVMESWRHQVNKLEALYAEFKELSGISYSNGPKCLREAFDGCGQLYEIKSGTGNPVFDKFALNKMDTPIAKLVKEIRLRQDYIQTYYSNLIHYADCNNNVHANINQSGTDTGRMSYSNPNLQNIPKEESSDDGYAIRKCFIPRDNYCYVMIDYNQMEYRMMADYAGESKLIRAIMQGEDVHTATANLIGTKRGEAKTVNFGLLYGMGIKALAAALKISEFAARSLKENYFRKLPDIKMWIRSVVLLGERRGYIFNWLGRRCHIEEQAFAYKLPNHLIQGGCADVVKVAMVELHAYLNGLKSRMLIQVHDEILFEVHKDELYIVPTLKEIMEFVYKPYNGMRLTCSVEHSWKSWGSEDKVEGCP